MIDGFYLPPKPAIILHRAPEIVRPGDPRFQVPAMLMGGMGVKALGNKRRRLAEELFPRLAGTNIGNMTSGGGLAAHWDGNESQAQSACGWLAGTGWVWSGKLLGASYQISKIVVISSSDLAFSGAAGTKTLQFRATNTSDPTGAGQGTLLGSATSTETSGLIQREIFSSDTSTTFDRIWVEISGHDNGWYGELKPYVMA